MGSLENRRQFLYRPIQQINIYELKLDFRLLKWKRPLNPTDRFFIGHFNNFNKQFI